MKGQEQAGGIDSSWSKEDICTHLGDEYSDFMGAVVPPIFQTSLFVRPSEVNNIDEAKYFYSRVDNPTVAIAETKIAALEGAEKGLCFSSGMGAITAAIMHYIKKDCHVVLVQTAYGPTRIFFTDYLAEKFGVTVTCVTGDDSEEIFQAVRPETTLIYLESPSSFVYKLQDLEAVATFAKERGIHTVIDNTYATPLHQNPIVYGIDIVCHTASKYLSGHSDLVAGALCGSKEVVESIRDKERGMFGACIDPNQAWLLIRGLRTLPVRLKQHEINGLAIAEFLAAHPKVKEVYYPALPNYPQQERAEKYLSGHNGLMSFVPHGTPEEITKMINNLYFFQNGVSWGGFESLITGISVGQTAEEAGKTGIPKDLVRIHVGLENVETLKKDLEQAFRFINL